MNNTTALIVTIVCGIVLLLILPFPIVIIALIVWGAVWGWTYEGNKIREEEQYYYEDEYDRNREEFEEFMEFKRQKQEKNRDRDEDNY